MKTTSKNLNNKFNFVHCYSLMSPTCCDWFTGFIDPSTSFLHIGHLKSCSSHFCRHTVWKRCRSSHASSDIWSVSLNYVMQIMHSPTSLPLPDISLNSDDFSLLIALAAMGTRFAKFSIWVNCCCLKASFL